MRANESMNVCGRVCWTQRESAPCTNSKQHQQQQHRSNHNHKIEPTDTDWYCCSCCCCDLFVGQITRTGCSSKLAGRGCWSCCCCCCDVGVGGCGDSGSCFFFNSSTTLQDRQIHFVAAYLRSPSTFRGERSMQTDVYFSVTKLFWIVLEVTYVRKRKVFNEK